MPLAAAAGIVWVLAWQAPTHDPAAPPDPLGYLCHRAFEEVLIDGKLEDDAWKAASWTSAFVDIEGDAKPRPRFKTRAKMLWDDRYFYVAAEMEEPHVWATLTKHDSVIFHDNDFEVFIDPDSDNHEYYEIEINALNTGWDLLLRKPYRDGGPAENAWEIPGLKSAVFVYGTINNPSDVDRGWSVELAIPWSVLREFAHSPAPPRDGDRWRVNFSRVEWLADIANGKYEKVKGRREDNWVWSPQGAIDMHRPEKWGYVQFTTDPAGQATFQPDPTAPARRRLLALYHAQRAHFDAHKKWAGTLEELGLADRGVRLRATDDGYEASLELRSRGGERTVVRIRQDSRICVD